MAQKTLPVEVSVTGNLRACRMITAVSSSTCITNSLEQGAKVSDNSYRFPEYTCIFSRAKKFISVTHRLYFSSTNPQALITQFSELNQPSNNLFGW